MNDMEPDQTNPQPETDLEFDVRLCEQDAAAFDALVQAGLDPSQVDQEHTERAAQIAALLGRLEPSAMTGLAGMSQDVSQQDALVNVTLARITRTHTNETPELCAADEAALQSWVLSGYSAKKTPGALRDRVAQLEAIQNQITSVPLSGSADALVEQSLARVHEVETARASRMNFETQALRRGFGVRIADLVSVAAVLLVGAAVMWPLLTSLRQHGQQTACFGNLQAAGLGFASYAGDNRDQLPIAGTDLAGPWWNTGTPNQSNSANLFQMVRTGHTDLDELACPGNSAALRGEADPEASDWASRKNVSYSYMIMWGPVRKTLSGEESHVILADRSPVVDVWVEGKPFFPMTNSRNHDNRGQHVLMTDGSSMWLKTPETASGDNIWLPRSIEQMIAQLTGRDRTRPQKPLTGTETVESARDVFLGP